MKQVLTPLVLVTALGSGFPLIASDGPRVIVTSDGEIDDECSLVRFLLYANEWDIEGIVTSSSQYHSRGHKWAGDDWAKPYMDAYEKVYPNLVKHDKRYPTPKYLRARTLLGNVKAEGEMDEISPGSQLIVKVLLDESDSRPVWLQAWGGPNTIARALKTIDLGTGRHVPELHPSALGQVRNPNRHLRSVHRHLLSLEEVPPDRQAGLSQGGMDEGKRP